MINNYISSYGAKKGVLSGIIFENHVEVKDKMLIKNRIHIMGNM